MEAEVGWMRGPSALCEIQREALGRAADRRAELNRRVHNPSSVRRWEEVAGAINSWETMLNEYVTLTGVQSEDETKMNSLMRLLPKNLYEMSVSQYGIASYAQLRSYVLAQCTRAKYGQHGVAGSGPTPMDLSWFPGGDAAYCEDDVDGGDEHETGGECQEDWDSDVMLNALKGKGKQGKGKGKGKGGKDGKDRSNTVCWWCNRTGHAIMDCYDLQNLKGKSGKGGGKGKQSWNGKSTAQEWGGHAGSMVLLIRVGCNR